MVTQLLQIALKSGAAAALFDRNPDHLLVVGAKLCMQRPHPQNSSVQAQKVLQVRGLLRMC